MLWAKFPCHEIAIPEVASQGPCGPKVHDQMSRQGLLKISGTHHGNIRATYYIKYISSCHLRPKESNYIKSKHGSQISVASESVKTIPPWSMILMHLLSDQVQALRVLATALLPNACGRG